VRHGFVGWTPLGLGFQIKSPKFLAASQPTGGGYAVERDRREGARRGREGAARKILRRGREVSKHGTGKNGQKVFCFSGALPPIPTRGSTPGLRWAALGIPPHVPPLYRLALFALAMIPHWQILEPPLIPYICAEG